MNSLRCVVAGLVLALPALAGAATHTVTIEGMAFRPATLTVRAGDSIVWHNADVVPHTATAKGRFDSGTIAPGQRWTWKAAAKGRHAVLCTLHPGMQAVVEVR